VQELADLQLLVPVDADAKSKMLIVDIGKKRLKVGLKGQRGDL
jgi:hypothetical protein